ncbi:MAG: carboxymuconolactone decarboxylase family protein [Phycisphaerales bacterium]
MHQRFDIAMHSADSYRALIALERTFEQSSIDRPLRELVKLRVSQVNGCAFCIDMHWKDLRAGGEPEHRLYALNAWRESPFYSDRERAALDWAEAVTLITQGHVPDDVYERVRPHFSDKELSDLTVVVATINTWNRVAIPNRTQVPQHDQA